MLSDEPRTISFPMRATRFVPDGAGLASLACLECASPLDLHQPTPDVPDRLLAVCHGCHGWHLARLTPDGSHAILVFLPDQPTITPEATVA